MKAPHLLPAIAAVVLAGLGLGGMVSYARDVEAHLVHRFAPGHYQIKSQGVALQRAAFRERDLLPAYGSSELKMVNPYHASQLFRNYPRGFTLFLVARNAGASLAHAQKLAGVGDVLRGKKVVISLTPSPYLVPQVAANYYAGNFSPLQAGELIFSTRLSLSLKGAAARRMLDYPETLTSEPLLRFALTRLADDSATGSLLYFAALPLGQLQNLVLTLQDHWQTISLARLNKTLPPPIQRQRTVLNWGRLLPKAEREAKLRADNNPFGFENRLWNNRYARHVPHVRGTWTDHLFKERMDSAKEWQDLDVLLGILQELGARPLVLCTPINGTYYDHLGASVSARRRFYLRLRKAAADRGFPLIDFAGHDGDKGFVIDPASHLSTKGWVYYSRAMEDFYLAADDREVARLVAPRRRDMEMSDRTPPRAEFGPNQPEPPRPTYDGSLDAVDADGIGGWAWDYNLPEATLAVSLFDGDKLLGTVAAREFRPDLVEAGKGNGHHGFVYPLPARLKDGKPHVIHARVAGTAFELDGSPQRFIWRAQGSISSGGKGP